MGLLVGVVVGMPPGCVLVSHAVLLPTSAWHWRWDQKGEGGHKEWGKGGRGYNRVAMYNKRYGSTSVGVRGGGNSYKTGEASGAHVHWVAVRDRPGLRRFPSPTEHLGV